MNIHTFHSYVLDYGVLAQGTLPGLHNILYLVLLNFKDLEFLEDSKFKMKDYGPLT